MKQFLYFMFVSSNVKNLVLVFIRMLTKMANFFLFFSVATVNKHNFRPSKRNAKALQSMVQSQLTPWGEAKFSFLPILFVSFSITV